MKIGVILPPISKVGGAQNYALTLHSKLAERSIDTVIYTSFIDKMYMSMLTSDNISLVKINKNPLNKIGIYTGRLLINSIKKENFDFIFSYSFPSNLNLLFIKKKYPEVRTILVWFGFLGLQIEMYKREPVLSKYFRGFEGRYIGMWSNKRKLLMKLGVPIYPILRKIDFKAMRCVDHVWVLSNHIKNIVENLYNRRAEKILFDAVDTDRFTPYVDGSDLKEKYNARKIIFSVSRLVPHKCIDVLIKAAKIIIDKYDEKDVKFIIGGEGPEKAQLRKLVQRLNLQDHVYLTGYISHEELPQYYNACDIFLHTGVNEDSGPITVLEAMSCGKPIIATKSGGVPEIVKHKKTGLLVPPFNPSKLAETIHLLLENEKLSIELGKNGRKIAKKKYSICHLIENVINTLNLYGNIS